MLNTMKGTSKVILILLMLGIGACGSYRLDEVQVNLRGQFAARNYAKAAETVEQAKSKNLYQEKDLVLYHLERGTSYHFARKHSESIKAFGAAEIAIDENFTKKISNAAKSLLLNDNQLAYDGEPYEDIYLNAFKSLDFVHQGNIDGALVEARRMAYKMENLEVKYKGMAQAFDKGKDEKNAKRKIEQGKLNIQASPLSHFLTTVYFAKTEKEDNARIEFTRLSKAISEQGTLYKLPQPDMSALEVITAPEKYNVMIVGFSGRAPVKIQEDIRIQDDVSNTYIKFSLPKLQKTKSQVKTVRIALENGQTVGLMPIEKMDEVVEELFNVKRPIIYTRTVIRAVGKQVANAAASKAIGKENELAGDIFKLAGQIAGEASEKADLRGWQTLPGMAHVQVLSLPKGTHLLKVEYVSDAGIVLFTEPYTVEVTGDAYELKLVESLYWN
jgi:hypothetical protein